MLLRKLNILNIITAFFLCFNFVYASINPLFNINLADMQTFDINNKPSTNLETTNRVHELYIEQTASGGYNPIKFNAETKFYYRVSLYKDRNGFLWDGNKAEFGIENNFSLASDMAGVYADIRPLSFFGIRAAANFIIMYNIMNYGYAGFSTNEGIDYSAKALSSMQKYDSFGFIFGISPYFVFKLPNLVFINNFSINYIFAGDKNYYFEPRTSILHKQSEIEIMDEAFILANINPIYLGGYYDLTYLLSLKIMTHKLGAAGIIYFNFLQDRLKLNVLMTAGLHIGLPNYNSKVFVEAKLSLAYRIMRK